MKGKNAELPENEPNWDPWTVGERLIFSGTRCHCSTSPPQSGVDHTTLPAGTCRLPRSGKGGCPEKEAARNLQPDARYQREVTGTALRPLRFAFP